MEGLGDACSLASSDSGAARGSDEVDTEALLEACSQGDLRVAEELCGRGADPLAANGEGVTPLLAAAFGGHAPVVRMLCGRGADVDQADPEGWTPVYAAAFGGHEAVVRALLQ
ncbi:unnamed protein product, partial [Prorocentrum cordatum]